MSLSDEILARPGRQRRLRSKLTELVQAVGAESAFLVDEAGEPFAAVGPIEFELPHPIGHLDEGGSLLGALVGEASLRDDTGLLVARVSPRALLAVALSPGASHRSRRRAQREIRRVAPVLEQLLLR